MKTIKEPDGPKSFTFECRKCKAVMEARENEGRISSGGQFETASIVFVCPHCQTEAWIDYNARQ